MKLSDYLFHYGSFLGFGTQVFWTLNPFFQGDRTLAMNGWYPYDTKATPYFELTNLFQNIASAFNIVITMNTDSFTINLMMEVSVNTWKLKTIILIEILIFNYDALT